MYQVKLFKGIESDLSGLENEINLWLAESDAHIVNVIGNIAPQTIGKPEGGGSGRAFAPSDVFMAVVYEK